MPTVFEKASRLKFRYSSTKGALTTEQLWDLPLTAANGCSLDGVAKQANSELKAAGEESFVNTTRPAGVTELETKLEVIKHIISVRLAENEAARSASERAAERERIRLALRDRKDKALLDLPTEALEKRLTELGG